MESIGCVQPSDGSDYECNGKNSGLNEVAFDSQKCDYSIYGILNFLQSEWTKMSIERSRWEFERAELQARITVLQNEKIGGENLKGDLVRRIKMLEYALQQERFKNYSLKNTNESNTDNGYKDSQEGSAKRDGLSTLERARLREYLTRIGMKKLSNEMRAAKVKELLGISPDSETLASEIGYLAPSLSSDPREDGALTKFCLNSGDDSTGAHDEAASALAEFDKLVAQQGGDVNASVDIDILADSFTVNIMEPPRSWTSGDQSAFVDRLKEHYRLGLPINRVSQSQQSKPSFSEDIPIPPHAYDEMELFASQGRRFQSHTTSSISNTQQGLSGDVLLAAARAVEDNDGSGSSSGGLGDLASLTSASALDNLDGVVQTASQHFHQQQLLLLHAVEGAGVGVGVGDYDDDAIAAAAVKASPAWTAKYTLRGHFDAIRAVTFHHVDQILLTGSEDCTLRVWSLAKRVQAKKSSCLDVEPVYTCRGHTAPVLCVALLSISPAGNDNIASGRSSPLETALEINFAFSGSLDGEIRSWRLGGLQLMLYEAFDPSVGGPLLKGHSDAVWSIAARADGAVLSASADGTVQLWSTFPALLQQPQQAFKRDTRVLSADRVFRPLSGAHATTTSTVPTSVLFLPSDDSAFAVGLTSGDVCVIHLETGKQIHFFESTPSNSADVAEPPGSVNALAVHPTLPLLFSAHENRQIRFLDTAQGTCLHSVVAHLEGVTTLAVDPRGLFVLSASHDASIRLWDVETRTCVQEFTSHRRKHDESIHSVTFHPTLPLIASAGADGLVKVYV
ncbi:striatin [Echinococcus multilocularis]|uniref:Striatin n=1 Tax=Echinococcus multilocularis TaxID=6211 RepID=A0A087VZ65_ECHMU|nr:striatin [Echinococcus multilocularis]